MTPIISLSGLGHGHVPGQARARGLRLVRKAEPLPDVPSPFATTGEDGSFALTTYENKDAAPEGDYDVAISTASTKGKSGPSLTKVERPVDLLKGRYADPKTSGLKAIIKPGTSVLEPSNLTEQGGASAASEVSAGGRER